ncbi:hypothetical protein [Sphingomonas sp. LaA6.9]|uniref:hypothetical protein n=1 Tax=Sphingomonas sp. LaA6.9 TaxID=2919914 RepID=UPI001F4FFBAD|nr:hypothetical protein [Sphingomonas sp. LaA6.9]MCJ8156571.1 hypothetical protein [Sphingomonas sp. LaA6.9]
MVDKVFDNIAEAAQRYTGNSRKAFEYGMCQMRIAERAKGPDYSEDEWNALDEFVDKENFERIGNFKEVMTYDDMKAFLKKWCLTSHWEGSFKRIHEQDNVVILELEERNTHEGVTTIVNSVSVYEFNDEGKLRHLDVYLQMPPMGAGFPNEAYEQ